MPSRFDTSLLYKSVRNPRKALRHGRFEVEAAIRRCNQYYYKKNGSPKSFDLINRDWDTAIILDACRYDYFKEENIFFEGELRQETAPGGASQEFIQKMFQNRELHDTVYVTGNPFVSILKPNTFHDIIIDENWDVGNTQAPPKKVTDAAVQAHTDYPNKRIIVHYMQPHFPIHDPKFKYVNDGIEGRRGQYWPVSVSRNEIREGYRKNLQYVLKHVKKLVEMVDGKIVITSDHGELLGERMRPIPLRAYNHYEYLYVPELLRIPWLELPSDNRRNIRSDPPKEIERASDKEVIQRLEAMGYV